MRVDNPRLEICAQGRTLSGRFPLPRARVSVESVPGRAFDRVMRRQTSRFQVGGPMSCSRIPVSGMCRLERRLAVMSGASGGVAEREGFEPSTGYPERHFQCRAIGL